MKKILFALGALVSCIASASTVSWGLSDTMGESMSAGTAYLVYTEASSAPSFTPGTQEQFTIDDVLSGADAVKGTATFSGGAVSGSTEVAEPAGRNKAFYVVLISSDGQSMNISTSLKKITIQASASHTVLASWSSAQMGSTYSTVPEPTTALLMALGIAGLALKRKRV